MVPFEHAIPETLEEVDITMRLIVDSYNFVTGADLDPETVGGGVGGDDGTIYCSGYGA
ncbi:MAG: hypothetical protein K0U93_15965 [Gammaproteobacteria bacterium]|nr:hypothetical protein [Gammaproteobacteria bacterium]